MPRQQRRDIEFALGVEAEIALGDVPPQQPIGADDLRLRPAEPVDRIHVDDEKMVAKSVERADVAPHQRRGLIGARAAFLEEHLVTQALRLADLFLRRRQPDFKRAEAAKNGWQAFEVADEAARLDEAGGGVCDPAERRVEGPHETSNHKEEAFAAN